MKSHTMDDLVLFSEGDAAQKFFDAGNYVVLKRLFACFAPLALGIAVEAIFHQRLWGGIAAVVDLLLIFAFFALRDHDLFARHFRAIGLGLLFGELQLLVLAWGGRNGAVPFAGFIFPLLLLFLRFRVAEYLLLAAGYWTTAALLLFRLRGEAEGAGGGGTLIGVSVLTALVLVISVAVTARRRRVFLAEWRRQAVRNRERLRLRGEIETARQIQLAMLPQSAPEIEWVELAAASLPANEVGGDYYDYFQLGPERVALVVGDVSGHGLASGLLLSGVRSCLYLLAEELDRPVDVLQRLNRMVRRTTDRRTFVTLLIAVVDNQLGTLSLASAGHPPLLCWSAATGNLAEVGKGALPLGTWLAPAYEQEVVPVASGDLLVLYSDGLLEARNHLGKEYGDERLRRSICRVAPTGTARNIRDAVLEDLSSFKGDFEQEDDITLVVVKVR